MSRIVPPHCHLCKTKLINGKCPAGHSNHPGWLEDQQMTCAICYHKTDINGHCLNCGFEG